MDYEKMKAEIQQIIEVCKDLPVPFQERCFELLLERLLAADSSNGKKRHKAPGEKEEVEEDEEQPAKTRRTTDTTLKLPAAVKAFMRRQNIQPSDIEAVVMIEDGEFHFIKEPSHSNVAKGQNEWALLLALQNAIVSNQFTVDPETVRSVVQDKGFYDKGNFATYFRKPKYASFYKGAMEPQGESRSLGPDGEAALGALVKSLAATSGS